MVEQGLEFAAARIQGLARGKHARRVVSAIWRQAEEYARTVVQGEREARMKKEKEQRAKAKVCARSAASCSAPREEKGPPSSVGDSHERGRFDFFVLCWICGGSNLDRRGHLPASIPVSRGVATTKAVVFGFKRAVFRGQEGKTTMHSLRPPPSLSTPRCAVYPEYLDRD